MSFNEVGEYWTLVYLALVLGTLVYPFLVEVRITPMTVIWAVFFASLTPLTTIIYALNHKHAMLLLRGARVQRAERQKRAERRKRDANLI